VPLGIPHSEFLKWDPLDQDKAIAYTRAKAEVCEMCGSREADWVDPETGRIKAHPPFTPVGVTCHGCAEIEKYRKAELKDGTPPGVRVILVPDEMVGLDGKLKKNPSE